MNVNVDAVLAFAGVVFAVSMSGLGALAWWSRRDDRAFREELKRFRR